MASRNYIAFADITHQHLKKIPESRLQGYIDEANDEIEDVALNVGLQVADIVDPLPEQAIRYCRHFVTMRFSEDSVGINDVEIPENDIYFRMRERADEQLQAIRPKLNYWILSGTAENDVTKRSVSFGKMTRVG